MARVVGRPPGLPKCPECGGGPKNPGYFRHKPDCPRLLALRSGKRPPRLSAAVRRARSRVHRWWESEGR